MGKQKVTRRERFLAEMDAAVPWARLVALIEPFYPAGKRGRPPLGVERMLRVYFLQPWYALADEALEATVKFRTCGVNHANGRTSKRSIAVQIQASALAAVFS